MSANWVPTANLYQFRTVLPGLFIILCHPRYARANTGIQFFDKDSLLPPPFTFLSILVKAFTFISDTRRTKGNAAR